MTGKSLGRGIEALIPDYKEAKGDTPEIAELLVDRINNNPRQPRSDFDRDGLEELAASIRENGIVQPITVRKTEDGYELIAGERRLRAVRMLGVRTIPSYVIRVEGDESLLQLALIENVQREDLNPMDEAHAYQELVDGYGLTQGEVADRVGKKRSTVANLLRLLTLPESIKESLRIGEITPGHGRAMLSLKEKDLIMKLFARTVNESLSVRQVEEIVRGGPLEPERKVKPRDSGERISTPKSPQVKAVEEDLMARFGTKVKLREKGVGGEVVIEYYSDEDLERLIELFRMIDS